MAFGNVALNIGLLFALCIPGYLLRRFKKLTDVSVKTLVTVLIYVAQPFTAAKSFLTLKYSPQLGLSMLTSIGIFSAVMLGILLFCAPLFRKKDENGRIKDDQRLYRFASMFGNTGYLGIPLISALFPGNTAMLLCTSLCIVIFNILTWTVGVWVLTGDRKYISLRKGLINPVPIAACLTIPFFFMQNVILPHPIVRTVELLGNMTTPLSMIILGARLAEMPFKEIFTDLNVYAVSSYRLILAPILAFAFLKLFRITDPQTFNTVMVVCSMPSAAATIVFAERFLPSPYTAVKSVLCSSIICIVTIPLVLFLTLI